MDRKVIKDVHKTSCYVHKVTKSLFFVHGFEYLIQFSKNPFNFSKSQCNINSCYDISLNTAYVWKVLRPRPSELQTNQKYLASYKDVVQHVHYSIRHHHPELWATGKWFLLYDNVQPQTALSVKEFLSVH